MSVKFRFCYVSPQPSLLINGTENIAVLGFRIRGQIVSGSTQHISMKSGQSCCQLVFLHCLLSCCHTRIWAAVNQEGAIWDLKTFNPNIIPKSYYWTQTNSTWVYNAIIMLLYKCFNLLIFSQVLERKSSQIVFNIRSADLNK